MGLVSMAYVAFLFVNLLLMITEWSRIKYSMPFRILLLILLCSIILELSTSMVFAYLDNNLFFYHIYNPVEFVLFSLFFFSLPWSDILRKTILIIIPFYLLFSIYMSAFVQGITVNNSYAVTVESIIIIIYSLLYLRYINIYQIEKRAEKNAYFWIVIGILFYFNGSLFIEGFLTLLIKLEGHKARMYYKIGFVFKYLMCCMFLISILVNRNTDKEK